MVKKKTEFDPEAAFKSIIKVGTEKQRQTEAAGKGRPKVERETKKRVSLAVYPSVYNDLQKIAYVDRQSVSDIVTELITKYVGDHVHKLKEYNIIKSSSNNIHK